MRRPWQEATEAGDLDRVRGLLLAGEAVDSLDRHGQTALMRAAHRGDVGLVRLLVEQGANLEVRAKYHLSALDLARIGRHDEVVVVLLAAGAESRELPLSFRA